MVDGPVAQPGLRHGRLREARPRHRRAGRRHPPDARAAATGSAWSVAPGEQTVRIPARGGLDARARACCAGSRGPRARPEGTRGDLAAAVEQLRRPPRRRGLAVVISDFLGEPEWERPLRALSARHELLAVEVLDPRELELPEVGTVVLADPETGRQREVVTTPLLCREFAAAAAGAPRPGGGGAAPLRGRAPARCAPTPTGSPTSSGSCSPASAPGRAGGAVRCLRPPLVAAAARSSSPRWPPATCCCCAGAGATPCAFTNLELLERIAPHRPGWYRHLPAAALIARAGRADRGAGRARRPRRRVPRNRATVVLVIDVSLSMQATDVEPSRLAAAQAAAKSFADQLTPGVNLGLVAFAGTAAVLVSPTTDRDPVKRAIDSLQAVASRPRPVRRSSRRCSRSRRSRSRRRARRGGAAAGPDRADERRQADRARRPDGGGRAARGVHRGPRRRPRRRCRCRRSRSAPTTARSRSTASARPVAVDDASMRRDRRAVRRAVLHRRDRGRAAPGLRRAGRADRLRDAAGRRQPAVAGGRRRCCWSPVSARASRSAGACPDPAAGPCPRRRAHRVSRLPAVGDEAGRSVLVTGGNRGIGLAIAHGVRRAGRPGGGDPPQPGRRTCPEELLPVPCDVTDAAAVDAAFGKVEAEARAGAGAGVQRRHHRRRPADADERGVVHPGRRRQPDRRLPGRQARLPGHAQGPRRPDDLRVRRWSG